MSDTPKEPEPEPETEGKVNDGRPWLAIFLNDDNSIKVTGHVNNKLLAYSLLECAKDSVREHINKQAKIERVNGSGGLINMIRRGF